MFQLYLLLRLKNFGRIVIELGIFRIVFLTILTVAAIMILFLAENRFVIPVVCVLLLASYHNYRKDKEFLHTLTSHLPVFLIKEYTLITLPFAGMEMIKGRFTEAIGLWLFATLLPFLKEMKLEHKPIFLDICPTLAFFHSRNRTRKYKNRQSVCRSMGIDTGVRLSATNGHRISSSFQKFQDFMPFPIEKYRMECFHHLHSFRLSTYSIYL